MRRKIVIAGFGDTGVLTAAHLGRDYDITAISTKPLLVSGQELGARLTRLSEWKENYFMAFNQFKQLDDVKVLQGKAAVIHAVHNQIEFAGADGEAQTLDYDLLVIASGTRNGFWRTDAVEDKATIEARMSAFSNRLASATQVGIVGGGPSAVSTASNLKEVYPGKDVVLFYPRSLPLRGYAEKTRIFVAKRLEQQGVYLRPGHRAVLSNKSLHPLSGGTVSFETGQADQDIECILWATGDTHPNNDFIPEDMLNADGFVHTEPTFQVTGYSNVFAIGDIAATDPHRSSARNMGYQLLAKNIEVYLSGKPQKMKPFKAPAHRWGSILGIQNEGLRLFTTQGASIRVPPWWVKKTLYPLAVDRMIYKGIRRK